MSSLANTSKLATDSSAVSGEVPSDAMLASSIGCLDDAALALDAKSKQRIFLTCYMLDQQHAALFGRPRTNCFSGAGMDLPFPRSQAAWDTAHGASQRKLYTIESGKH